MQWIYFVYKIVQLNSVAVESLINTHTHTHTDMTDTRSFWSAIEMCTRFVPIDEGKKKNASALQIK